MQALRSDPRNLKQTLNRLIALTVLPLILPEGVSCFHASMLIVYDVSMVTEKQGNREENIYKKTSAFSFFYGNVELFALTIA